MGEQIFFFKNKVIFIQSLTSDHKMTHSDFLFDISDLNQIDFWKEDYSDGNEVGHFSISKYSDSPEALLEPPTVINHIIKIRDLILKHEFRNRRSEVLDLIPVDDDGNVALSSCLDLDKLLREYQSKIVGIDRSYIQKFVKSSQYLKTKYDNIQRVFSALKGVKNLKELDSLYSILLDEIHVYNLVLLHSLNMVSTLVDDDMISFYETYELFDSLNIFDSQWEKDTSRRLDGISSQIETMNENLGSLLQDILFQSRKMESNMLGAINNLSEISQKGYSSINNKLSSVHSTLKLNTLLSGIQVYQNHKMLKG